MAEAKTQVPPLRYCSELLEQIDCVFNWLENAVSTVLPDASIEHIGSSAVPGSLTKGDVDIMVLVDETEIMNAVSLVKQHGMSIEGAAGVAVAAYQQTRTRWTNSHVAIVICGGNTGD